MVATFSSLSHRNLTLEQHETRNSSPFQGGFRHIAVGAEKHSDERAGNHMAWYFPNKWAKNFELVYVLYQTRSMKSCAPVPLFDKFRSFLLPWSHNNDIASRINDNITFRRNRFELYRIPTVFILCISGVFYPNVFYAEYNEHSADVPYRSRINPNITNIPVHVASIEFGIFADIILQWRR
jgi:hypothetical protein